MLEKLPLELSDIILDVLRGLDRQAMTACSLVDHTWLGASRSHIFRDISIDLSKDSVHDLPQGNIAKLGSILVEFSKFLRDSPNISRQIRTLMLYHRSRKIATVVTQIFSAPLRAILDLLRILPNLNALKFRGITIKVPLLEVDGPLEFPSMTELAFICPILGLSLYPDEIYGGPLQFSQLFPNLERLTVIGHLTKASGSISLPLKVSHLHVSVAKNHPGGTVLKRLREAATRKISIRSFALDIYLHSQDLDVVGLFLMDARNVLQHIHFHFHACIDTDMNHLNRDLPDTWKDLNLSRYTKLESLRITFTALLVELEDVHDPNYFITVFPFWNAAMTVLGLLRSTLPLLTLVFECESGNNSYLEQFMTRLPWDRLAKNLKGVKIGTLRFGWQCLGDEEYGCFTVNMRRVAEEKMRSLSGLDIENIELSY
ncbi:hypothetical protein C8Q75DRAFT_732905 [Abortiporus biennis]|nr:hypothetical protein C8Q75DRAFT_732905 [Abortiporus biennis]